MTDIDINKETKDEVVRRRDNTNPTGSMKKALDSDSIKKRSDGAQHKERAKSKRELTNKIVANRTKNRGEIMHEFYSLYCLVEVFTCECF